MHRRRARRRRSSTSPGLLGAGRHRRHARGARAQRGGDADAGSRSTSTCTGCAPGSPRWPRRSAGSTRWSSPAASASARRRCAPRRGRAAGVPRRGRRPGAQRRPAATARSPPPGAACASLVVHRPRGPRDRPRNPLRPCDVIGPEHRLRGRVGQAPYIVDHVCLVVETERRGGAGPALPAPGRQQRLHPPDPRQPFRAVPGRCDDAAVELASAVAGVAGQRADVRARTAPPRPAGRDARRREPASRSLPARMMSASGTRRSTSSLAGTPNSAVNAPGRSRMPRVSSPGSSDATIAELSEPTTSSPMMSVQPSGMTRSWRPGRTAAATPPRPTAPAPAAAGSRSSAPRRHPGRSRAERTLPPCPATVPAGSRPVRFLPVRFLPVRFLQGPSSSRS